MALLDIRAESPDGSRVVLRVSGRLDISAARQLQRHAEAVVFLRRPRELHIDVRAARADGADSALASALAAAGDTAAQRLCRFVICHPAPRLRRVLVNSPLHVCSGHEPSNRHDPRATYTLHPKPGPAVPGSAPSPRLQGRGPLRNRSGGRSHPLPARSSSGHPPRRDRRSTLAV